MTRDLIDGSLDSKAVPHQPNNVSAAGVLLPCPFCGSSNISEGEVLTSNPDGGASTQSMCRDCGALGPDAHLREGEVDFGSVKATAAWNRRAAASAQTTPIYQTSFINDQWRDVDRVEYDRAKSLRSDLARIVYTAPSPAAREAGDGVRLTDERILAINKDAISTFFAQDGKGPAYTIVFARALLREAGSQ